MPSSEVAPLRIYCVCGQKMKVSEDMFGRPGKCVACRLKIRIPTPDEIPPNTDVIYLKDHPELLRKVRKGAGPEKAKQKEEAEVAPLPDIDPKGKVRKALGPLDVLDPLRQIHSLVAKLEKRITGSKLVQDTGSVEVAARKDPKIAELLGIRTRIRAAEQDLEEELRQRLMETAIELAATNEKLAELNLAVRVAELPYSEYRTQVDRLRRRRDNHERRQSNLRGWLTVEDVHRAGGAVDVAFEHIPTGTFRITFANEIDDNETLLDVHVESLRGALADRAQSERKLSEAKKLKAPPSGNGRTIAEVVADAKAQHERTQARVQHARERLEQLADDYSNDMQAIDAQLDHSRGRLQVGQLKREEFAEAEEELRRAKTDLTKARALVVRALNANSAEEVPRARGTFVARLAHGKPGLRAPMDAWVAWAGAALVLAALFLPIAGGHTALQLAGMDSGPGSTAFWYALFPIGIAVFAVAAAFIPSISARGLAYCAVWLLACLLTTTFLHESAYNESPVSAALRVGGPLLLRPGMLVYALGLLAVAAAGVITLAATRDGRVIIPLTAIATVAGVGAVVTDLGGVRTAQPELSVETRIVTDAQPPEHEVTVSVKNSGGRELLLAANSTMRNAYALNVEKRIGKNSGIDVSAPVSVRVGNSQLPIGSYPISRLPVLPGQAAALVYRLPEGEYRATLKGASGAAQEAAFTLEPVAGTDAATAPNTTAQPTEPARPVEPQQPTSALMDALAPEVTLRGILTSENRAAQFSITVRLADGATSERAYAIGDEVYTNWTISEFNPAEQTITLSNGKDIMILRRGEPQRLGASPSL
ncbi:MAG: hypothetical protein HUU46_16700 [Candidatus Hydrogenedentes bacterium]|nr:hypothetical protein [Candidatus Hydrogenedentota bacterium]